MNNGNLRIVDVADAVERVENGFDVIVDIAECARVDFFVASDV